MKKGITFRKYEIRIAIFKYRVILSKLQSFYGIFLCSYDLIVLLLTNKSKGMD